MFGQSIENKIDSIVKNGIENRAFPGCVIYASQNDSILFFKSYGFHTYDSVVQVRKSHIYDLASLTKVMAGTLSLMKLYEDGLIRLDDPIEEYIEGLGKAGKVTLREALAHQGGLYPWIPYYKVIKTKSGRYKWGTIAYKKSERFNYAITDSLYLHRSFYAKIKRMIRKSGVSEKEYKYSGLFFYLIPEIVENLSGQKFEEYLKAWFYDSLQAETLCFNPLKRYSKSVIVPTEKDTFFRNELIHGKVHDEGAIFMKGVSGNAGLFGSASDVAKVWKMLLNHGVLDSITYLNPHTIDLFTTTQFPNKNNRRALGFDKPLIEYDPIVSSVAKSASFRSFGHSGYTGTLVWADPESDLLYIFLSNRVYPTRENKNLYHLNIRPSIHEIFYDYISD